MRVLGEDYRVAFKRNTALRHYTNVYVWQHLRYAVYGSPEYLIYGGTLQRCTRVLGILHFAPHNGDKAAGRL